MTEDQSGQTIGGQTIGERLRAAREARDMSLDEVATRTRIPLRHLQHIEAGEWDSLPAITYSVGFARSYANAVGLNGAEIGVEVREKLGSGPRYAPAPAPQYYEPADPARVPPRSLALVALVIGIVILVGFFLWRASLGDDTLPAEEAGVEVALPEAAPVGPAAPIPPAADGAVVLTATDDVWLRVYEEGGATLYENILSAGQSFEVPSNATRPLIRTGRPNALRVTVGQSEIPALGAPERTINNVSLSAEDLLARLQAGPAPAGQ